MAAQTCALLGARQPLASTTVWFNEQDETRQQEAEEDDDDDDNDNDGDDDNDDNDDDYGEYEGNSFEHQPTTLTEMNTAARRTTEMLPSRNGYFPVAQVQVTSWRAAAWPRAGPESPSIARPSSAEPGRERKRCVLMDAAPTSDHPTNQ